MVIHWRKVRQERCACPPGQHGRVIRLSPTPNSHSTPAFLIPTTAARRQSTTSAGGQSPLARPCHVFVHIFKHNDVGNLECMRVSAHSMWKSLEVSAHSSCSSSGEQQLHSAPAEGTRWHQQGQQNITRPTSSSSSKSGATSSMHTAAGRATATSSSDGKRPSIWRVGTRGCAAAVAHGVVTSYNAGCHIVQRFCTNVKTSLYLLTYMAWVQPKHPAVKRLGASTAHGQTSHTQPAS
jgi:hypothetical protein